MYHVSFCFDKKCENCDDIWFSYIVCFPFAIKCLFFYRFYPIYCLYQLFDFFIFLYSLNILNDIEFFHRYQWHFTLFITLHYHQVDMLMIASLNLKIFIVKKTYHSDWSWTRWKKFNCFCFVTYMYSRDSLINFRTFIFILVCIYMLERVAKHCSFNWSGNLNMFWSMKKLRLRSVIGKNRILFFLSDRKEKNIGR